MQFSALHSSAAIPVLNSVFVVVKHDVSTLVYYAVYITCLFPLASLSLEITNSSCLHWQKGVPFLTSPLSIFVLLSIYIAPPNTCYLLHHNQL